MLNSDTRVTYRTTINVKSVSSKFAPSNTDLFIQVMRSSAKQLGVWEQSDLATERMTEQGRERTFVFDTFTISHQQRFVTALGLAAKNLSVKSRVKVVHTEQPTNGAAPITMAPTTETIASCNHCSLPNYRVGLNDKVEPTGVVLYEVRIPLNAHQTQCLTLCNTCRSDLASALLL